jgi:hypothetical protein
VVLESQLAAQQAPLSAAREAHDTAQWKQERHGWGVSYHDERFLCQQKRLNRRVERTLAKLERLCTQQAALLSKVEVLTKRLAEVTAENAALPSALSITIRLDAGFSTDANLAWLIEIHQSHCPYTDNSQLRATSLLLLPSTIHLHRRHDEYFTRRTTSRHRHHHPAASSAL